LPDARAFDEGITGQDRAEGEPMRLPGRPAAGRIAGVALRFHSELLVKARVELGLTQEQAAQAVGVDVRTYRRYESGEVNEGGGVSLTRASRRKLVQRLVRELGVSESELLVEVPAPAAPEATATSGHALPRAAHFVGRRVLVDRIVAWTGALDPAPRVLALVGLGGSGKTSIVERALAEAKGAPFVWSFYDDPRVETFFAAALRSLAADAAHEGEQLERLTAALAARPGALLVLDGLESVQATGDRGRARGELEDSRLRLLLRALARGIGRARALVTSRFALVDLAAWEGDGLETQALPPLAPPESIELLRSWGLRGSDGELGRVADAAGGHALSAAVLGSYIGSSLGGDPAKLGASGLGPFELGEAARDDGLARRLDRVLAEYARTLSPLDRDVLARVCAFPQGAGVDALARLAGAGGDIAGALAGAGRTALEASLARLERTGLAFAARPGRHSAHPFVRQHFQALLADGGRDLHEVERRRLAAELDARPAARPLEAPLLDAYEALFEHTLLAGDLDGATALYFRALGGFAHLGLRIGELARGLRMVRAFGRPPHGTGSEDAGQLPEALPRDTRGRIAYEWGLYVAAAGELPPAIRAYDVQLALATAGRDDIARLTVLRTLAYTYMLAGEELRAMTLVEQSIAIARDGQDREGLVRGIALRGALLGVLGEWADALRSFELGRALGDVPVGRRAFWEAEVIAAAGDRGRGRALVERNLAACEGLGWAGHVAHGHALLGTMALADEDAIAARAHHARAEQWCRRSGEAEMVLRTADLDSRIRRAAGDRDGARTALAGARELARLGGFGAFLRLWDGAD
jgi:transcriptional regulator with XRE-family HTH domain